MDAAYVRRVSQDFSSILNLEGDIYIENRDIRWAVPQRPESGWPLISAELARFVRVATWQSLRATSICWPFPVLARPKRAAIIELEVYSPVVKSVTATPTLTGGPSREPVMCIKPISASTMTS